MSLALLGVYGASDDDEEADAGAAEVARGARLGQAQHADASDSGDDAGDGQGDVEMPPAPAAAADSAGPSLLPSADDLLGNWTPAQAAPPPRRSPAPQRAHAPPAPARAGGHLVPPQVASGKANLSTEDRESDRLARSAGSRPAGQPQPPAKPAGKAAAPVSWRAKEKRKRDAGQQSGGKDFIQDEKRQLRHAGENFDS